MNKQPQFKLGDMVKLNAHAVKYEDENPFAIKRMELWNGNVMIWTREGRMIHESHFELYEDPKKKYAIVDRDDGMIIEFISERKAQDYIKAHNCYDRAPEFDTERE